MIQTENHSFPNEALPGLINVMYVFNKALQGQIEVFKQSPDYEELAATLASMGQDLVLYIRSFDAIYQDAETPEELQQLETLAKLIAEGKDLVVKASKLLGE